MPASSALLNTTDRCDVININNAYVQKVLDPAGCITRWVRRSRNWPIISCSRHSNASVHGCER